MGAVVPVAGAVLGTVSTFSQISAQRKQAEAQKEALAAQERGAAKNLDLRLQEIERQRLYAKYQSQLEEMARRNDLAFASNEDQIQRQEINLAEKQQQIQALLENLQIQSQSQRQVAGIQQGQDLGGLQRDVGAFAQDKQRQIEAGAVAGRQAGERVGDLGQLNQALTSQQLQFQQNLEGLLNQYGSQNIQAGSQDIAARQAGVQAGRQLQGIAEQGDLAQKQGQSQLAQARLGLGQDGLSQSDRAFLSGGNQDLIEQALQRRRAITQGQTDIQADIELSNALTGFARSQANANLSRGTRDAVAGLEIARNSAINQAALGEYGRQLEGEVLGAQQGLGGFITAFERDLGAIDQSQQAARQMQQINEAQTLAQGATDYQILQAALDAGLNQEALTILEQARAQRYALENAAANLNNIFTDQAFSQQAFSTINAGQAQINSLAAQRSAIQSPGFLSYASALGQGAMGIREALYQPPTSLNQSQGAISRLQPMGHITPKPTNAAFGGNPLRFGNPPYQRQMTDFDYRA